MSRYNLSPVGDFLKKFDEKNTRLSASQIYEIEKQERIERLRDGVTYKPKKAFNANLKSSETDKRTRSKATKPLEW